MKQIKFAILGAGWRSRFYARIATAAPWLFSIKGVWAHNDNSRIAFENEFNFPVFSKFEDIVKLDVDFIVLCMSWDANMEYSKKLIMLNIPALTETPVAPNKEALTDFWNFCQAHSGKIQVAEEYHLQPYHAAVIKLVKQGCIGIPNTLTISMMHGYHCTNIARQLLGIDCENATIYGEKFNRKVIKTCNRTGTTDNNELGDISQEKVTVQFENGKTLFYDFCDEQYFSLLRSQHLWICGERGEVFDQTVKHISPEGKCVSSALNRVDLGIYGNLQAYTHQGFSFNGSWLYENPIQPASLADDELAIATCLCNMKEYVDKGIEFYTLKDALQDTYLSFLMKEAIETKKTITTTAQAWSISKK